MRATLLLGAAALCAQVTSSAVLAAPDLAGKTMQVVVASGPGGLFDIWARIVARHISRHLPGTPTVIVQNMPGAGGITAANFIYNIAPKDGTVIGLIQSANPIVQISGLPGPRFDATKLTWLGTPATETHICFAYNSPTLKVHSVKDLYTEELSVGTTGPGSADDLSPKALRAFLGLKFKIISGFRSSAESFLALERGEVDSICIGHSGLMALRPDWIRSGQAIVLTQSTRALKDVAYVGDLAKSDEERQALNFLYTNGSIGRPFVAPPDLTPDVVTMLRSAFDATMKDPEFIAEVRQQNLDLDAHDGAYLDAIVARASATPKPIIQKLLDLAN